MSPRTLLLIVLGFAPTAGYAQGAPPPQDPTQVARAFLEAVAAERWRDAAAHLDLEAFDAYRRQQISSIRAALPPPMPTAEDLMRHDPEMPREAAEYQVRRMREARGRHGDWITHEYAGVTRLDSLAALSPLEAAARWLEARDPRYQMRRSIEEARARRGCPPLTEADMGMYRPPPPVIVGAVVLDSVGYVLYHEGPFPRPPVLDSSEERRGGRAARRRPERSWHEMPPTVLQLRRVAGAWRLVGGMGMMVGRAFGVSASVDCEPRRPGG